MRLPLLLLFTSVTALAWAQDVPQPRPRPDAPELAQEAQSTGADPQAEAEADEPPTTPTGEPLPRPRPPEAPGGEEAESAPAETPEAPAAEEPASPAPDEDDVLPVPSADEGAEQTDAEAQPLEPRIYQAACPAVLLGLVEARALPPIAEPPCMEQSPLEVTGVLVNGRMVPLSAPATVNCEMAMMLPDWAEAVEGFAWARDNTRLESINVGTSFLCRPRNSAESQFVSEHGFADALDVVGFSFEDGRRVDVQSAWNGTEEQGSRIIRFAHDAACSRFMTTLGPEANAEHQDHLHIDMGCHGESCTARLCE